MDTTIDDLTDLSVQTGVKDWSPESAEVYVQSVLAEAQEVKPTQEE